MVTEHPIDKMFNTLMFPIDYHRKELAIHYLKGDYKAFQKHLDDLITEAIALRNEYNKTQRTELQVVTEKSSLFMLIKNIAEMIRKTNETNTKRQRINFEDTTEI